MSQAGLLIRAARRNLHSGEFEYHVCRSRILLRYVYIYLAIVLLTVMLSSSARGQQSTVLVGTAKYFAPDDPMHPDQVHLGTRYSTVLITMNGAKAIAEVTLPDIIVPHGKEWWRVGVRFGCQVRAAETDDDEENVPQKQAHEEWFEQSYSSAIEKTPQVPSQNDQLETLCPAQLIHDFEIAKDSRTPNDAPPVSDWEPFEPCIYESVAITAVTTNYISTTYHSGNSSACTTRGFTWGDGASVSSIEDLSSASYLDLPGGLEEYERVLIESEKDLQSEGLNCGLSQEEFDQANRWAVDGKGWFLSHEKGKWKAVALLQPGNASCQYGGSLSLPLPEEIVGHDVLRPGWASLQRQIPELQDAFASPAGDLVVAVKKSQLEIYRLEGQRVGHKLLALPANRVVMVQWATGKNVRRWVEELQAWQQKGLPAPVVLQRPD